MAAPILLLDDVHLAFGGLPAIDGASFAVAPGSITALIGPNGAGKTTLFNAVTGFYRMDRGRVFYAGRSISGKPPHVIARLGLVRTFQITKVLSAMSVLENMALAAPDQPGEQLRNVVLRPRVSARQEMLVQERARELLALFDLAGKADEYAGALSGGQRKLLELARVLMADPRIVLLDEPGAGVNPTLLEAIMSRIAEINRRGVTLLIVEHNMELVARLCRHVYVMAAGRLMCEGTPSEVVRNPDVIDAYLGSRHA